jgi:hypothetical protein
MVPTPLAEPHSLLKDCRWSNSTRRELGHCALVKKFGLVERVIISLAVSPRESIELDSTDSVFISFSSKLIPGKSGQDRVLKKKTGLCSYLRKIHKPVFSTVLSPPYIRIGETTCSVDVHLTLD